MTVELTIDPDRLYGILDAAVEDRARLDAMADEAEHLRSDIDRLRTAIANNAIHYRDGTVVAGGDSARRLAGLLERQTRIRDRRAALAASSQPRLELARACLTHARANGLAVEVVSYDI
ncbi:hypothetical protein [Thiohalocapsa marina]|uniref:hypothetical protein n=1 Tax=Thiohalocapsa marina TaxID=424902 RepID=UPI0036DAB365